MRYGADMKVKGKSHELTLSLYSWVMGSADCLTEMIIWVKFIENLSKGSGYGADTKWRLNPMILKCDLESE